MASESRLTIVALVKSLHTLHTDTILQLVKEVVKKPHQIKGDQVYKNTYRHSSQHVYSGIFRGTSFMFYFSLHQKSTLVDIPMLQFSYTYIQR